MDKYKYFNNYKYTDKEVKELLKSMKIIVDTREQKNKHIIDWLDKNKKNYVIQGLEVGDYSFLLPKNEELGLPRDIYFTDEISIERKANLNELSGNFTQDRTRIENEFIRNKGRLYLMIENASYSDICNGKYDTKYNPKAFIATLHSFQERYDLQTIFMQDISLSGQYIYATFYYYLRNQLLNR